MSTTADTSHAETRRIRPARVADADSVFALLLQLAEAADPDRAAFDVAFHFLLGSNETASILVVEDDSAGVVGYALTTITPLLHVRGSSAQLQELVVDGRHSGEGIGTALVEEVERLCVSRGVSQLTVPSRRSADFYERIGYRSTADFLKRSL